MAALLKVKLQGVPKAGIVFINTLNLEEMSFHTSQTCLYNQNDRQTILKVKIQSITFFLNITRKNIRSTPQHYWRVSQPSLQVWNRIAAY